MIKRSAVLSSFIALFIAGPVFAQSSSLAQLHLVVVDQTGAGIPAATITLTPAAGGTAVTGVSDEHGVAELANAPVGSATLHVTPFVKLTRAVRASMTEEAEALIRFAEPEAKAHVVRLVSA